MKLQVVMVMSQLDDGVSAVTGEKVNFKDRLQKTRVKKQINVTPRDGGDSSSRSHSINTIASTNPGSVTNQRVAPGEDLNRQMATSMDRKIQQQRQQQQLPPQRVQ